MAKGKGNALEWIVWILVVIFGGLNAGLAEFGFDLVAMFGGFATWLNYLIGIAAIYMIYQKFSK